MSDITKLEEVAGQAAEKMMQVAEKYGPHAIDLTLEVGRLAAAQLILPGIIALMVLLYCLPKALRQLPVAQKASAAYWGPEGGRVERQIMDSAWARFWFFVVPSVPAAIVTALCLGNASAWVGLFRPEIYLAAKLLNL